MRERFQRLSTSKFLRWPVAALLIGLLTATALACGTGPSTPAPTSTAAPLPTSVFSPAAAPLSTPVPPPDVAPLSTPVPPPDVALLPTPPPLPMVTPLPIPFTPTPTTSAPLSADLRSEVERASVSNVGSPESGQQVQGNNAFAMDLYLALGNQDGNIFYSPYSISLAFAMLYAGAGGETERQIAEVMHYTLPQEDLHPTLNSLDAELASRGQAAEGEESGEVKLNVANAIWGESSCSFSPAYLDTLALNYGAGLKSTNFAGAPEKSRETINKWVEDQTEDRIKNLVPQGAIDPSTVLTLTNAIYFDAAWRHSFPKDLTRDRDFHLLDGSAMEAPMMHQLNNLRYTEGDGYQALELPYAGDELSMLVLLPGKGGFKEFEESLSADLVKGITDSLNLHDVAATMPKFEFESAFSLAETLAGMGMAAPFTGAADFSGMDVRCAAGGVPAVSGVFHKGFVLVEEEGTEAAAATAIVVVVTSEDAGSPPPPKQFIADRPFIFLIRDNPTGSILFVGRVLDPR